ncbi:hypothetical protein FGO68_gene4140 [Halteria grandinella]|uniref:Uncharacterized protein n=1 Tax=Halteria grandinella TaxID=5974 RepID=A0A8J8P011_HALGN|nr:hypothetical protein FGO68_gene4140 [Halteria grandinella]
MDCKQIIVETGMLDYESLREFFNIQSKANKFIECDWIKYSTIEQVEWAFKYFTQKCLNKEIRIDIGQTFDDAKEIFEKLFHGSLKVFKNKSIKAYLEFNCNVCYQNPDKNTQSLSTNNLYLAVLALNNCTALTKLTIYEDYSKSCYLKLQNKKLSLQELIIE